MPEVRLGLEAVLTIDGVEITNVKDLTVSLEKAECSATTRTWEDRFRLRHSGSSGNNFALVAAPSPNNDKCPNKCNLSADLRYLLRPTCPTVGDICIGFLKK
jgi:hypothetical protein